MRISLIVRPRDRMPWMEELRSEVASLRDAGHEVVPRLTFEGGDAERMARSAAESGTELIIAAGGDGTVNEVVNGAAGVGWTGPLGILPLGTANDFALSVGIPEEIPAAMQVAVEGGTRTVDLARVNDRHFINVSTGGFGAIATEDTPAETKRLLGPLAYLVTGVQKFNELHPSPVRISTPEGEAYEGEVMLYAVGNGWQTGAGSQLTPRAELDDGQLDVMILPAMSRMDFVSLAPRLRAGTHVDHPDVVYFRAARVVVESDEELSVNADGEPVRGRRFEYEITGEGLGVRVP